MNADIEPDFPDHAGSQGARDLKDRLEEYWWSRGHPVEFKLVAAGPIIGRTDIRSNLVNGLPRSALGPKLCPACAAWTKKGLPVRCSKCEPDGPGPVRAPVMVEENNG